MNNRTHRKIATGSLGLVVVYMTWLWLTADAYVAQEIETLLGFLLLFFVAVYYRFSHAAYETTATVWRSVGKAVGMGMLLSLLLFGVLLVLAETLYLSAV